MGIAAIWARVSTEEQQSLDYQVAEVKAWLESQGYHVPENRILKVHWTSLAILDCPEMQTLLSWVRNREIDAIGTWHSDRLSGKPAHKVYILDQCQRHGVQFLSKNSPLIEGREGELLEYLLAWAKEGQVLYAQQGSKGKLHDRAKRDGLPTTCQPPYGYQWDESRRRLLTTTSWENRALIVMGFVEGATIKGIQRELHERVICSPKGGEWWPEPTIWLIIADTVNYGEYRALRRESIEPKVRRGTVDGRPTYGKTSSRKLPGFPLPNIEVEKPIITKAQYDWILHRLEQNKLNARRNGKRDYLLRGLVQYQGDGLRYYGRHIRGDCWAYVYSARGNRGENPRTYLPGRKLEAQVETLAREVLTSREVLERELGWRQSAISESIARIQNEIRGLERKSNTNANAEMELVGLRIRRRVSDEAYEKQLGLLQVERRWIREHRERLESELARLQSDSASLVGLEELRDKVAERLASQQFSDRRFILEALGTRVVVTTEGQIEVEFAIPSESPKHAIAFNVPPNACPLYSVVPLPHPLVSCPRCRAKSPSALVVADRPAAKRWPGL
jgi:DNA invertase Pin-like site-specific DNA recombinase